MSAVKNFLLPLLLVSGVAQVAHAECVFPKRPVIPDGKTVSKEHLLEVIDVFKNRFQPDVRAFQNCIKNEQIAVGNLATEDQKELWASRHDAAYDIESRLATALNQAIRDFKARESAGEAPPAEETTQTSETSPAQPADDSGDDTREQ